MYFSLSISFIVGSVLIACLFDLQVGTPSAVSGDRVCSIQHCLRKRPPQEQHEDYNAILDDEQRPMQDQAQVGHAEKKAKGQSFPWKKILMNMTCTRMLVETWRAQRYARCLSTYSLPSRHGDTADPSTGLHRWRR